MKREFAVGPEGFAVPVGAPDGFVPHTYRRSFATPHEIRQVWEWLNDPATFTESQVWPYRVEFVDGGFEPGVLNVHHGPLLNAAGVIGAIEEPGGRASGYRDLKYFYGSYALSPRLARPTRLQFWADRAGDGTLVTVQLDALVRRAFMSIWGVSQGLFWSRFPAWMHRDLSGRQRGQ